jgi:uncharacterized RDD family membrane protein YckC
MSSVPQERQLTIDTPEQVALEFQIAGLGSRAIAFIIDSVVQGLSFVILFLLLAFLAPGIGAIVDASWAGALFIIGFFLLYWGYFAFFEAIWKGQTPGKRNVGIRVVKDNGRAINAYDAIGRNLMRAIDQLPGMYLFGLICMMISKENRRIGDYVAGTLVVHEKSAEEVDPDLQNLDQTSGVTVSTTGLTGNDLELIESFLHRRLSLEPMVRSATAIRMVQYLAGKGVAPVSGQSDEEFLQVVAKAIRDGQRF